jgi:ABC-type glycerol-3-phosphate transport system substrate-binding protein
MAQGGAFSFLTFNWMIPKLNDPNTSQVVGKVQIAPMPGGKGLLGGWGWALPKSSPNPDAGWAFIEWVESFPIAKARALAGGAPTRSDVFDDPDVVAKYPHYKLVKQLVQECVMLPIISRTPQLVEILGREMSEAVSGNKQAKDALDAAAKDLATIVD